ncbi:hypothetical protein [Nitrosopumilus adriaticus]|uniref:hypothetical protein n=1 Tax=Nitrosopumilus adriaticus TaxID=1580092 RepID=UPI00352EE63C
MAIKKKIILILFPTIVLTVLIFFQSNYLTTEEENYLQESPKFFNFNIETKNIDLVDLEMDSIFKISGVKNEFIHDGNFNNYARLFFEFKNENMSLYDELKNTDEKTIVIYPIFTATAYNEPGFYNFYREECNLECLTIPIKPILRTEIGGNGAQILRLLNYNFLSDIDIDKNPEILKNFDKVILLHNEYVTKNQFDAITSHHNVIYLYPNALYAEIEVDYDKNTITLIRGHGFPEKNIDNGFDWEFDNTRPYEFDLECDNWKFYEIDNGKMLNCFPERQIYEDASLLRALKEL